MVMADPLVHEVAIIGRTLLISHQEVLVEALLLQRPKAGRRIPLNDRSALMLMAIQVVALEVLELCLHVVAEMASGEMANTPLVQRIHVSSVNSLAFPTTHQSSIPESTSKNTTTSLSKPQDT